MMFIEHTYTDRRNITSWRCFNCGKYFEISHDEVNSISHSWFLPSTEERMKWQAIDRQNPKLRKHKAGMVRMVPLIRLIKSLEEWIKKEPSEHLEKLLKNAQDNLNKLRRD